MKRSAVTDDSSIEQLIAFGVIDLRDKVVKISKLDVELPTRLGM